MADMVAVVAVAGVQVEVRLVSVLAGSCETLATSNTLSPSRMKQRKKKTHILTTRKTRTGECWVGDVGRAIATSTEIPALRSALWKSSATPQKLPGHRSPLVASSAPVNRNSRQPILINPKQLLISGGTN